MRKMQVIDMLVLPPALLLLSLASCKYHGSIEAQRIARTNAKLTIVGGGEKNFSEERGARNDFGLKRFFEGGSPYLREMDTLKDEWNREFVLTMHGGGYTVSSFGADGLASTPDDLSCQVPLTHD